MVKIKPCHIVFVGVINVMSRQSIGVEMLCKLAVLQVLNSIIQIIDIWWFVNILKFQLKGNQSIY